MFYRFDFLELILIILNVIILEFCVFLFENFYVFFLCFLGKGGDCYLYYFEKGDFFLFFKFLKNICFGIIENDFMSKYRVVIFSLK